MPAGKRKCRRSRIVASVVETFDANTSILSMIYTTLIRFSTYRENKNEVDMPVRVLFR